MVIDISVSSSRYSTYITKIREIYLLLDLFTYFSFWAQFYGGYLKRHSGRQPVENLKRRKVTLDAFHESAPCIQ